MIDRYNDLPDFIKKMMEGHSDDVKEYIFRHFKQTLRIYLARMLASNKNRIEKVNEE